jgi:beta-barrel assembly-enhancing protease
MKSITLILKVLFLLTCINASAQVKDIGISFQKRGFVQSVHPKENGIIINFVQEASTKGEQGEIIEEILFVVNPITKKLTEGITSIEQLRSGMELNVTGEHFKNSKYSVASKIEIKPIQPKEIEIKEGRVDGMKGEYAYIDGHRVKLNAGTRIQGKKPENAKKGEKGYEGKTFGNFGELKPGDIAHVKGNCSAEGCYKAAEVGIMPNEETDFDKNAKWNEGMKELNQLHADMHPTWSDSTKREVFFGQPFIGGKIYANKIVQNLVSRVGMSLIPEYAKETLKFMFVVVENPEFNAFVLPTGLSVVNTGLFSYIENEAQLAAVLGHEIGHAIYEHGARKLQERQVAEKKKGAWSKILNTVTNVTTKVLPNTSQALLGNNVVNSLQNGGALNTAFKVASNLKIDRQLSNYSIDYELQADRVGLFLMVQAGYDPREAPKIWRNVYNLQNPEKDAKGESVLSQTLGNAQGEGIEQIGKQFLGNVVQKKITEIHTRNQQTHPDNINRFLALNQMIELYWSDKELLSKMRIGRRWR